MSFCVSGHPGVTSVCPSCELPCRLPAVSLARAPSSWIPADAGVLGKGQRAHLRLQSLEFRKKQDTSPRQWRLPSPWVAAWPSTPASVSLCRRCPCPLQTLPQAGGQPQSPNPAVPAGTTAARAAWTGAPRAPKARQTPTASLDGGRTRTLQLSNGGAADDGRQAGWASGRRRHSRVGDGSKQGQPPRDNSPNESRKTSADPAILKGSRPPGC